MGFEVTPLGTEVEALARFTGADPRDVQAELDDAPDEMSHWIAWDRGTVIGAIHVWPSPDGKVRVFHEGCRPDAVSALFGAAGPSCVTQVDAGDGELLAALRRAGFLEVRREDLLEVPVARLDLEPPAGIELVDADGTDPVALLDLDVALRADTPGSEGWRPDLDWFVSETYDSPFFDPRTYRVAVDGEAYVGLVRVWAGPIPNRLGHVGVRAGYRRRRIASALIASVFEVLSERGVGSVTAEVDEANVASQALFRGLGARVVGGTVELAAGGDPARNV